MRDATPEPPAPTPSATTCPHCGGPTDALLKVREGFPPDDEGRRFCHACLKVVPPASAPAATAGNTNSVSIGSSLGVPAPTGEEAETPTFDTLLAAWESAIAHNARIQGKDDVSAYHEDDPVDEAAPRAALLKYLHDIETRCDPAGEVQRIASLEEQVRGLTAQATELAALREAADTLAAFAKTAPGRLPQRVQDAIAALAPRQTTGDEPC